MRSICYLLSVVILFSNPLASQTNAPKMAPMVSLEDMLGRTAKVSDFRGKIVMLNFWAAWCVPCAAEVPQLVKWQKKYGRSGLQIIGITYPPTNKTEVRNFARKKKVNYPILFGTTATKALFDKTENLPVTIIIDRRGNVIDRIEGIIFEDEFENVIKPLLRRSSKFVR